MKDTKSMMELEEILSRRIYILLYPDGKFGLRGKLAKADTEQIKDKKIKVSEIELSEAEKLFLPYLQDSPMKDLVEKIMKALIGLATEDLRKILI